MAEAPQKEYKLFEDRNNILNSLDDNEKDLEKIVKVSHKYLMTSAFENALKILKEETKKKDRSEFNKEENKRFYMIIIFMKNH